MNPSAARSPRRRREHPLASLTAILRLDPAGEERPRLASAIEEGLIDWEATITFAQQHLLAGALWPALAQKDLATPIPEPIRRFLRERAPPGGGRNYRMVLEDNYLANAKRNAAIREQALAAIDALNAAGIEPAVLKGTRIILAGSTAFSRGRTLRDIDLLVPEGSWARACTALGGAGYRELAFAPHAASLAYDGGGVEIDLHRRPLSLHRPAALPDYLTAEGFWRQAKRCEVAGRRYRALPASESLVHSILHTEVADLNFAAGDWPLRYLYETAVASRDPAGAPDWSVLERIETRDLRPALRAHLHAARCLFAAALPAQFASDWPMRGHFLRCRINARYPRSVRRIGILLYKLGQAMSPWYLHRKGFYEGRPGADPTGLWQARWRALGDLSRRHVRRLPKLLFGADDGGVPPPRV